MYDVTVENYKGEIIMLSMEYHYPVGTDGTNNNNPSDFLIKFVRKDKKIGTILASRRTYQKIVESEYLEAINPLLAKLPYDSQFTLFMYYEAMIGYIRDISAENVVETINAMTDMTIATMNNIDIFKYIIDYVETENIPYPNLSLIGTRERDSVEMSFHLPEYKELTGICILCKLMAPVWGELIAQLQLAHKNITNTENREPFCLQLILELLEESPYQQVVYKLWNYMVTMTNRHIDFYNQNDKTFFVMGNSGMSEDRYHNMIIATVIVKKLVPFNIWHGPKDPYSSKSTIPDIMRHIASSTKDNGENKFKSIHSNTPLMPRFTLDDKDDDDDNVSQLEHISVTSHYPADLPILIKIGFKNDVGRFLKENNIPEQLFVKSCEFYHRKILKPNPFAESIMSSILVRYLDQPSITLSYLGMDDYIALVTLTQIILLRKGNALSNLVPFLSSNYSEKELSEYSILDQRLLSSKYRDVVCSSIFNMNIVQTNVTHTNNIATGKIKKVKEEVSSIRTQVTSLVAWIVKTNHKYLLSPHLIKSFNLSSINNDDELHTYENLLVDIYAFFSDTHHHEKIIM